MVKFDLNATTKKVRMVDMQRDTRDSGQHSRDRQPPHGQLFRNDDGVHGYGGLAALGATADSAVLRVCDLFIRFGNILDRR